MRTETAVLSGAAAQTILDVTKEKHVDLIVLCSHGETGFTRRTVGSVAQKIARYSPVPVLVLGEGSLEALDLQADAAHPLRALVALDGSPLAETALVPTAYLIAVLAAPAQGALHLTRVVKLPIIHSERAYQPRDGEARKRAEDEAATYLSTITNIFGFAAVLGLQVTWSVTASEDVADALIRMAERGSGTGAAEAEGCSLIALTTHGRGAYQRWRLGSVTERVLHGTTLPLFIVRPQQEHIEAEYEVDKTVPSVM